MKSKKLVTFIVVGAVAALFSLGLNAQSKPKNTFVAKNWKLGVALYTFSTASFPEQLAYADSASLKYVEGFVFAKAGKELQDSALFRLSPSGLQHLKKQIADKGLKM